MKHSVALVSLLSLAAFSSLSWACSTAMIRASKSKVMGKNYDWHYGHGRVFVNRKNVRKIALTDPTLRLEPMVWRSRYPSITFNQIAENFPNGGMNSKGVGVEVLISSADYPRTTKKKSINELQWIQYILDTSENTAEAIRQARKVDVVPLGGYSLHYHVCDQQGDCAAFEYVNGELVVVAAGEEKYNENPCSLTNSRYSANVFPKKEVEAVEQNATPALPEPTTEPKVDIPTPASPDQALNQARLFSPTRKGQIETMIESFADAENNSSEDEVTFMYKLLSKVSLFPKWQIVYELAKQRVHFRASVDSQWTPVQSIDLATFDAEKDLDCQTAEYKAYGNLRYDLATRRPPKVVPVQAAPVFERIPANGVPTMPGFVRPPNGDGGVRHYYTEGLQPIRRPVYNYWERPLAPAIPLAPVVPVAPTPPAPPKPDFAPADRILIKRDEFKINETGRSTLEESAGMMTSVPAASRSMLVNYGYFFTWCESDE